MRTGKTLSVIHTIDIEEDNFIFTSEYFSDEKSFKY